MRSLLAILLCAVCCVLAASCGEWCSSRTSICHLSKCRGCSRCQEPEPAPTPAPECSVIDGSGMSSTYPCQCGSEACTTNTPICTSATSMCAACSSYSTQTTCPTTGCVWDGAACQVTTSVTGSFTFEAEGVDLSTTQVTEAATSALASSLDVTESQVTVEVSESGRLQSSGSKNRQLAGTWNVNYTVTVEVDMADQVTAGLDSISSNLTTFAGELKSQLIDAGADETALENALNLQTFGVEEQWCSAGIQSGNVCCAFSCGRCGGSGCSSLPGGASNCCVGGITDSGRQCTDSQDTACLISQNIGTAPMAALGRQTTLVKLTMWMLAVLQLRQ